MASWVQHLMVHPKISRTFPKMKKSQQIRQWVEKWHCIHKLSAAVEPRTRSAQNKPARIPAWDGKGPKPPPQLRSYCQSVTTRRRKLIFLGISHAPLAPPHMGSTNWTRSVIFQNGDDVRRGKGVEVRSGSNCGE